ncbi:MAG: NAD(P)/FAD-dependent oxidoreductase [Elusimicrobiota bacterium]
MSRVTKKAKAGKITAGTYDAIVFGGGPAGSTAGNLLAHKGYRVLVIEKDRFPRHHIGESLLPGLNSLYRRLGVEKRLMRSNFFLKTGGTYIWGPTRKPWSIWFMDLSEAPTYLDERSQTWAYHVDRDRFDKILLDQCARRGAEVVQPALVKDVGMRGRTITHVDYATEDGKTHRARAKFYFDATGLAGLMARKMRWRVFEKQLRHIAVYSYFEGARLLPGEHRYQIFVVNNPDGWIWYIPLAKNRVSVGVVTSSKRLAEAKKDMAGFLMRSIERAPEVAKLLKRAKRTQPMRIDRDWSYCARRFIGDNFLLIGDAASFIDPLLTYGVAMAMHASALAADCVDLALREPKRGKEFLEHFEKVHRHRYKDILDFVKFFYSGNRQRKEYFWKARRILNYPGNSYAKYAFTFMASAHYLWKSYLYVAYFRQIFQPIGLPVERLRKDRKFLEEVKRIRTMDLAFIDEPLLRPGERRSLVAEEAKLARLVEKEVKRRMRR